ncbi:MAG: ABC transporter ATP-binding protein [Chloroflexota bacterium]|nr:ABC transporter ATP-binding protein [Chloroflexota bacterium]
MKPLLQVSGLRIEFPTHRGGFVAVDDVSFEVSPGERLGLIGESGSGKSTIALSLMRLIKPPGRITAGQALFESESGRVDLFAATEEQMQAMRLAKIALVTQGAMNSLNPVMRIRHQMIDAMEAHGVQHDRAGWQARLVELLGAVNLKSDVADLFPHQLSGGMKQRVCIAIAISLRPLLIIADEPTSALDVVVQRRVMQTLRRVQRSIGAAVILIGHDMGLMAQFAQRVAVMKSGRIVETGDVRQIFAHPSHPYTRLLMHSLPSLDPISREQLLRAPEPDDAARLEPV